MNTKQMEQELLQAIEALDSCTRDQYLDLRDRCNMLGLSDQSEQRELLEIIYNI